MEPCNINHNIILNDMPSETAKDQRVTGRLTTAHKLSLSGFYLTTQTAYCDVGKTDVSLLF
jgi:hypothetical protein